MTIEYKVMVQLDWCDAMRELHAPDGGWRSRQHVSGHAAAVAHKYTIHRREVGTVKWQLMVESR
jgi:hypothetical protein